METNDNEDTTIQNLWDKAKADLRGKYIAIQASIQKLERIQIQNLTLRLKELKKKQQIDPTPSRRRELKIQAEDGIRDACESLVGSEMCIRDRLLLYPKDFEWLYLHFH